jgi:amidophosphoribosyltransferase
MPAAQELIAHEKEDAEIGEAIGADWLIYQELEDLIKCGSEGNPSIQSYEDSVFSGNYVTGDVKSDYLLSLEAARSDSAKDDRNTQEAAAL